MADLIYLTDEQREVVDRAIQQRIDSIEPGQVWIGMVNTPYQDRVVYIRDVDGEKVAIWPLAGTGGPPMNTRRFVRNFFRVPFRYSATDEAEMALADPRLRREGETT